MISGSDSQSVGGGAVFRAVGLLFGLALATPLIGIVMIPIAAVSSLARLNGAAR